jgi:hypothetical protein
MDQIRFRLRSGVIITMEQPTVQQYELAASNYTATQVRTGHMRRFTRDLLAASITHIDDKPVDIKTDLFSLLTKAADWFQIENAARQLFDEADLQASANRQYTPNTTAFVTPSGLNIVSTPLTLDELDQLEFRNAYTEHQWLKATNDRTALSIRLINGLPVTSETDLRLEIPQARDWMFLTILQSLLNAQQDIPDFLPLAPG